MEKLLQQFIQTLDASFKTHLRETADLSSLTVNQILYLEAIHELDEASVTALAEKLNVTKASTTVAVNKLVNSGYIAKSQSDLDKRVLHLSLTPKSKTLIKARTRALEAYGAAVRAALSDDEALQFEEILKRLVKHFSS